MPLVRHSCLREAWLSMAQVSDTKDIGGDTWKEAGVGEFARTFGGNWGEVGWKLKGKWEGIGEKVRRNLRGSIGGNLGKLGGNWCQLSRKSENTMFFFNGVSKGKTPNTVCLKVFRKRQHKTSAGRKRRREDSSLGPPFLQTRSPKTTFSGTSSNYPLLGIQ